MFSKLILWDIYEVQHASMDLNGVMLRGRIRKFGLLHNRNILVENTEDTNNQVRFAVPNGETVVEINEYLEKILPGVVIVCVKTNIANPILSKLRVNLEERYTL